MRVFKEQQQYRHIWIIGLVMISAILHLLITTEKYLKEELSIIKYLVTISLFLVGVSFVFFLKLKTRIDETGIHYQFFPFHFKFKVKTWYEMEEVYVREYDAILEYGGWGVKKSRLWNKKKGNAYSVNGNKGIQLVLKNKKKILIGTQKESEVVNTINHYLKK